MCTLKVHIISVYRHIKKKNSAISQLPDLIGEELAMVVISNCPVKFPVVDRFL